MTQRIELDEVTLEKVGDDLLVTHKRTQAQTTIKAASLQRWLIRQLRNIFN